MRQFLTVALLLATVAASAQTAECNFENFRVPFPGVYDTGVNGMNHNRTIVGDYTVLQKRWGYWVPFSYGFMRKDGQYYEIKVPGRGQTSARALNDRDEVVGDSWPGYSGPPKAFLLDAVGYHELDFPGYYDIFPTGIDNRGRIIGAMASRETNTWEGFLFQSNQLHSIMFPGSTWSYVEGMNEADEMIGDYGFSDGLYHGFLLKNGTFSTLDYPGADNTLLWAINDHGTIVGSHFSGLSIPVPFKWESGRFQELPYDGFYRCNGKMCPNPTAFITLNDSGQLGGNFLVNDPGFAEGFVATCK